MLTPIPNASRRMLWPAVAVALCLSISGCGRSETYCGIEIIGSEKFTDQIHEALSLIHRKSPDDLKLIASYVKRIEEHDRSGMVISQEMPTCQLAPASAYSSLTWCAGCIAHEAHHAKLSHRPSYVYGLAEEEKACNAYQRGVLERIGATRSELDHLARQDGNHFDRDGDGEYTWEDYEARDW